MLLSVNAVSAQGKLANMLIRYFNSSTWRVLTEFYILEHRIAK
jgi:hypothetical protein